MNTYYLQTLEGAPRLGAGLSELELLKPVFQKYLMQAQQKTDDRTEQVYIALWNMYEQVNPDAFKRFIPYVRTLGAKSSQGVDVFLEAWQAQLEAEAAREALDARKRADKERRELEQAQLEAEAAREALDARKRADRDAREAEAALEQAQEIINEGESMAQNIPAQDETDVTLDTQLVTSGQEFTFIDETDETISYVDEAGELHVEQKAKSGLGWIIAAASAFFLLS